MPLSYAMVDAEKTYNNTIKVILTMQKKNLLKSPIAKGISLALGASLMSPLYAQEAEDTEAEEFEFQPSRYPSTGVSCSAHYGRPH